MSAINQKSKSPESRRRRPRNLLKSQGLKAKSQSSARIKRLKVLAGLVLLLVVLFLLIPLTKFKDPCSTVVYAANRELLGARIAADGQWRFAPEAEVPENYAKALMLYEDRYFYYH